MTTPQRITLMADWWPKACEAQGWDKNDKPLRLKVLGQAVGRTIFSANDLNNREDIDAVKAHLGMLADNIPATVETDHPEFGQARRMRVAIREQLKCLALYCSGDSEDLRRLAAEAYLAELLRDKFQHGARAVGQTGSVLLHPLTIDDLSAERHEAKSFDKNGRRKQSRSELEQLLWAMARALRSHRQAAGHTVHDMRIAAGLKCNCSNCSKFRRAPVAVPAMVPAGPEEDTNPF